MHDQATAVRRAVDLLGDADPDVRLRAAVDLGEGRHAAAAAALVGRFGRERDFQVREILTWATLRMPEAALPLVRDAVDSPRWLARLQATHTLSKVGAPEDAERLLALVDDPVDCVAARAWWAVGRTGDDRAVPALAAQLGRGSAELRTSLLDALAAFPESAVPHLGRALRSGVSPAVREHAADVLAWIGAPVADVATAGMVAAVDDPDPQVRVAALNALGQVRTTRAWQEVERRRRDDDPRLRALADRLAARRPHPRLLRQGDARVQATGPLPVDNDTPVGRRWPRADLDLVTLEGGPLAQALTAHLALQVQVCGPRWVARADVPPSVLAEIRDRAFARARAGGRPEDLARRVAAGAAEQYVHDHVLLEQVSVADPGKVVRDLLHGTGGRVTWFAGMDSPDGHPGVDA